MEYSDLKRVTSIDTISVRVPPFPIFITGGQYTFLKGSKHFTRTFEVFDCIYVRKGCLFLKEEQEEYEVTAGQYLILVPGREHGGYKNCTEDTDMVWFHFLMHQPHQYIPAKRIQWSDLLYQEGTHTEPSQFHLQLPQYGKIEHRQRIEGALEELIHLNEHDVLESRLKQQVVFEEILIMLQKEAFAIPSAAAKVTEQVITYIQQHYQHTVTMTTMSKQLHYHADYITRSMKKTIGITPVEYIQQYRIAQAKTLLVTTNMKLKDIAVSVGIQDYTYFPRLFKKQEGMSPNIYRRLFNRG